MMNKLLLTLAALSLVAAACGGSDDGVASLEGTDGTLPQSVQDAASEVDDEQALLAFAACMRDNGVPDFPDPRLSADGSVDFSTLAFITRPRLSTMKITWTVPLRRLRRSSGG